MLYSFVSEFDFKKIGESISNFLNSALHSIDWAKLGKTISGLFLGAIRFLSSSIKTFDWEGLGKSIADCINNIDWAGILSDLGTLISDILSGALDLLLGFVQGIDWGKLAQDLWNGLIGLVSNIDWGGIIAKGFELLGSVLGAKWALIVNLAKAIWNSLKKAFKSTCDYFNKYIKEAGGNIIKGLFNGIVNAIKGVGTWIYDHIFKPFINGFKKVFGIHSPSKEMGKMGGLFGIGLIVDLITLLLKPNPYYV